MDYGKFKYRESKKRHEAKLKQKQIIVKEVKFRPGTDEGDYKIKLRNLIRFLEEGDKTKVTLRFRGREMAHQEFGIRLLERVRGDLEPYGVVEQWPKMEGRQLVMVLAPKVKPVQAKRRKPSRRQTDASKPARRKPRSRPESPRRQPRRSGRCSRKRQRRRQAGCEAAGVVSTDSTSSCPGHKVSRRERPALC